MQRKDDQKVTNSQTTPECSATWTIALTANKEHSSSLPPYRCVRFSKKPPKFFLNTKPPSSFLTLNLHGKQRSWSGTNLSVRHLSGQMVPRVSLRGLKRTCLALNHTTTAASVCEDVQVLVCTWNLDLANGTPNLLNLD